MSRLTFSPLAQSRHALLQLTLEAEELPTDDLTEGGRAFFELAEDGGLVGFIGLEGSGTDRLLRSLVVLPTQRGSGFGERLLTELEAAARSEGVERLHLLTQSAAPFFRDRGYADRPRSNAPNEIAETRQFKSLCPDSAHYLTKDIA